MAIGSFNKNKIESSYSESGETKIIKKQNRLIELTNTLHDQMDVRMTQLEKDNNIIKSRLDKIVHTLNS